MSCNYPTRGARPAPIWHRALCSECRSARRADALISFAIDCRKAEPTSTQALGRTLALLDLPYSMPRPRKQRAVRALRAAKRPAAYLFAASAVFAIGWTRYIDIDPGIRIPAPAISGPNGYDDLQHAIALIRDEKTLSLLLTKPPAQPMSGNVTSGMPMAAASGAGMMGSGPASAGSTNTEQPKPYTLEDKEAYVLQNRGVLEAARRGFGKQFLGPIVRTNHDVYADYSKYRWIARLFRLQAENAAERGNWSEVVDSCLDAIELGALVRQNGGLTSAQSGHICQAAGRIVLWNTLDRLPAADARRAMDRLGRIASSRQAFYEVLSEEKRISLASLQNAMRTSGWRSTWASFDRESNWAAWLYSLRYSKRQVMSDLEKYFNKEIQSAKQPFVPHWNDLEYQSIPSNKMIEIYAPACDYVRVQDLANDTENQLLVTSLAIRAFYLQNGRYPRWMNELPEQVRLWTADPFGAGSFGYHLTEKSYTLYSVGPDGQDNQGAPIRNSSSDELPASSVVTQSIGDIVAGVNKS